METQSGHLPRTCPAVRFQWVLDIIFKCCHRAEKIEEGCTSKNDYITWHGDDSFHVSRPLEQWYSLPTSFNGFFSHVSHFLPFLHLPLFLSMYLYSKTCCKHGLCTCSWVWSWVARFNNNLIANMDRRGSEKALEYFKVNFMMLHVIGILRPCCILNT